MAARPARLRKLATPTTAIVGLNVYRHRVMQPEGAWSRKKLAAVASVSEETIRLLEQNRIPSAEQLSPHLDTIDKLALAFGVEPATLYQSATPSYATGRSRHLRSVPGVGDALPTRS